MKFHLKMTPKTFVDIALCCMALQYLYNIKWRISIFFVQNFNRETASETVKTLMAYGYSLEPPSETGDHCKYIVSCIYIHVCSVYSILMSLGWTSPCPYPHTHLYFNPLATDLPTCYFNFLLSLDTFNNLTRILQYMSVLARSKARKVFWRNLFFKYHVN